LSGRAIPLVNPTDFDRLQLKHSSKEAALMSILFMNQDFMSCLTLLPLRRSRSFSPFQAMHQLGRQKTFKKDNNDRPMMTSS
jgi:hypothetical protein